MTRRDAVLLDAARTLAYALSNAALIAEINGSPQVKGPLLRAHAMATRPGRCNQQSRLRNRDAPGVATTALANPATGVTLTVPVTGSLVVSGYAANGSGSITLPAGHAALYNSTNIGSAHAAASYANAQPAGDRTDAFVDTNPTDPVASAAVFVPASAVPVITSTSPGADATSVPADANLVATFSETIQKGNGSITIHQADGTLFESISVGTSAVSVAGGKVTINPANNFIAGRGYYVLIDPTALRNTAGQYYAGIADSTVWNFTALPDLATVDGRLEWSIQQNISDPWPATAGAPGMASYALAAMHLGTEVEAANHFINQFHSQFPVPDSGAGRTVIDFEHALPTAASGRYASQVERSAASV